MADGGNGARAASSDGAAAAAAKDSIRAFLGRYVRQQLGDDDDIFASGFVNSLLAMQLVTFVERNFAIAIGDEDLERDNFRSVAAIAALVERKRSTGAGG